MFCRNCGSEIDPNSKVCKNCGAEQEISKPDTENEPTSDEVSDEEEEEGSWIGGIVILALIGIAIWALVHFNPSEEDHFEEVRESVVEQVEVDGSSIMNAALVLDKLQYKSIGVASWTYVKY